MLILATSIVVSDRCAGVTMQACPRHRIEHAVGLICDANAHDFGEITLSEARNCEHHFTLQNTGTRRISILDYSSTCGCTSVELEKKFIEPNECLDVLVETDWSSRPGKQEETVCLNTDHPKTAKILLTVRGFIVARAVLTPGVIDFGLLKPRQQKTQYVSLAQGADTRPFKICGVTSNDEHILVNRMNSSKSTDPNLPLEGGSGYFAITLCCSQTARQVRCSRGVSHGYRGPIHTQTGGESRLEWDPQCYAALCIPQSRLAGSK
jgi:hypothetical protein